MLRKLVVCNDKIQKKLNFSKLRQKVDFILLIILPPWKEFEYNDDSNGVKIKLLFRDAIIAQGKNNFTHVESIYSQNPFNKCFEEMYLQRNRNSLKNIVFSFTFEPINFPNVTLRNISQPLKWTRPRPFTLNKKKSYQNDISRRNV